MTLTATPTARPGELTAEERLLQQTVRDFAAREVAPGAAERDEEERYDRSLFARMGELGLTGVPFSEDVGGAGGDGFVPVEADRGQAQIVQRHHRWRPPRGPFRPRRGIRRARAGIPSVQQRV